jgi:hypothetical protein
VKSGILVPNIILLMHHHEEFRIYLSYLYC